MKKITAGVVIFLFALVFFSVNVMAEGSVAGIWNTIADHGPDRGKTEFYIEIFEKSGLYYGKIVKLLLKPKDALCNQCPENLKDKPLLGMIILKDMKKTGKADGDFGAEYAGGTIMDPENGKSYKCKLWVKGDVITERTYGRLFYRTRNWHRVK
ncbi:MAG: hypothetical protein A2W19_03590 [Spirochaetes bacterium RBG_16_49_21]|nr:MAG: hypothetical protein A2W19_03590 [Spirochaetes bacterium RBG_16_49_21]